MSTGVTYYLLQLKPRQTESQIVKANTRRIPSTINFVFIFWYHIFRLICVAIPLKFWAWELSNSMIILSWCFRTFLQLFVTTSASPNCVVLELSHPKWQGFLPVSNLRIAYTNDFLVYKWARFFGHWIWSIREPINANYPTKSTFRSPSGPNPTSCCMLLAGKC